MCSPPNCLALLHLTGYLIAIVHTVFSTTPCQDLHTNPKHHFYELLPNGHQPPPLLPSSDDDDEGLPDENVVSCPPESNRSLLSLSPPIVMVCVALLPALASPLGIMPRPPVVGGAVMSLTGGPISIALGSAYYEKLQR